MDAKGTIKLIAGTVVLEMPIEDMGLHPGGFWVKGMARNVAPFQSGRLYHKREVYDEDNNLVWISREDFRVPMMTATDTLALTVKAKFNSVDGGSLPVEATDENILTTIEVAQRILEDTA